jgi:hypothetical protein
MSLYTHWTCFDCRKSFRNLSEAILPLNRTCPDCGKLMYDFGAYFQPPRRQAKRQWAIMRLLAEHHYGFHSEGMVAYVNHFIIAGNRSSIKSVRQRIEQDQLSRSKKLP